QNTDRCSSAMPWRVCAHRTDFVYPSEYGISPPVTRRRRIFCRIGYSVSESEMSSKTTASCAAPGVWLGLHRLARICGQLGVVTTSVLILRGCIRARLQIGSQASHWSSLPTTVLTADGATTAH